MTQSDIPKTPDIAIVGGGLAGMLAGLALAHSGFSSIVIDRNAEPLAADFDGRTTALAYGAVRVFEQLGLWQDLAPKAGLMSDIMISDGTPADRFRAGHQSAGFMHFRDEVEGVKKPLGFILENRHLRAVLEKAIAKTPQCSLIYNATMRDYRASTADVKITLNTPLNSGDTIVAKLVLACDGRGSRLRAMAGIRTTTNDYHQTALTFVLKHSASHDNVAHQYFLPDGPFATLPMTDNRSSVVWSEKSALTPALLALPEDQFIAQLKNRLGDLLGEVELASKIYAYPLSMILPVKFFADRLVLIGDAAHGIHPIAGQGFNLGVKDIAALCDVLVEMRDAGLDIGHGTGLEKYERWRRHDTTTMALGSGGFNLLFTQKSHGVRALRSAGMSMLTKIAPLNQRLMRHAGADLGELPSLMRE